KARDPTVLAHLLEQLGAEEARAAADVENALAAPRRERRADYLAPCRRVIYLIKRFELPTGALVKGQLVHGRQSRIIDATGLRRRPWRVIGSAVTRSLQPS